VCYAEMTAAVCRVRSEGHGSRRGCPKAGQEVTSPCRCGGGSVALARGSGGKVLGREFAARLFFLSSDPGATRLSGFGRGARLHVWPWTRAVMGALGRRLGCSNFPRGQARLTGPKRQPFSACRAARGCGANDVAGVGG